MGVSEYGLQHDQGPYKTVAQIWEEAAQQGSQYRTLTAKHRYKIVKDAAGDSFIAKPDLKKVKTLGKGSFGTGTAEFVYVCTRPLHSIATYVASQHAMSHCS